MDAKFCAGLLIAAIILTISACSKPADPTSDNQPISSGVPDSPLIIQRVESPSGIDSREPDLNATHDGRIVFSWIQKVADKRYALKMAIRDAGGWSEVRTVAEGENWFINWADFPSVIALKDGSLAAHWLVKSGSGTYAYDVNVARSMDGGKTWSQPIVPHLDKTQTEHGFVSLIPLADGRVGAVWLDGRNMKDVKDEDEHTALAQSMTLRYAAIDAEGKLSDEAELDQRVCECCQTSAALTSEGAIAVYRDRLDSEVRDISYVRAQSNGGWIAPKPLHSDNWVINGCPVNGPSIAAEGRRVAVAWFTSANETPRVRVGFSNDAGMTFGTPIEVDDGNTMGRVDVALLPDGSALVCWLAGTAEGGWIKVRRVRPDGTLGPATNIAETDISRSSGFPRMALIGDEVYFAWTEFGQPSHVRMATANVSAYR